MPEYTFPHEPFKIVNVYAKDMVPGVEFFNSDFRCWEPCTKVVPDGDRIQVHSAVDYARYSPDYVFQVKGAPDKEPP